MCPNDTAGLRRLTQDPSLASCNTVAEIYGSRPGIGAVVLGGNHVGPTHKLPEGKVDLHFFEGSRYVAKCCFVGSSTGATWTDDLLLAHDATIGDLKRVFYERYKTKALASALTSSGLQGVSETNQLNYLFCQDVDGQWLGDSDKLPTASPTSCADVGYHTMFLLDLCAPSMRPAYVKERIKVSDAAIDNFISTPKTRGALSTAEYPSPFDQVRSELGQRLTAATRSVPSRIPTSELRRVKEAFCDIEKENKSSTSIPRTFIRSVEDVIRKIETRDVDALDPDWPPQERAFDQSIGTSFEVLLPFVKTLAHLQSASEWINYESKTDPEQEFELSLAETASEIKRLEDQVRLHEDIHLLKSNTADMSGSDKNQNKKECMQLANHFEALHGVFEKVREKKGDLQRQRHDCKRECDKSLTRAKEDASRYMLRLQDEHSNLRKLATLSEECETFHQMECEQIHWCKSFFAASSAISCSSIQTFEHEIQRLQHLCQLEKTRREHSTNCYEHLNRVEANARARAEATKEELASATRAATERAVRANKAVLSSEPFQTKLISLHQELQQEMKDMDSYKQELLKALAVDCHAAYLGAGKFLAIQALKAETNLNESEQNMHIKLRASLKADAMEDIDLQDTVERAEHARRSVFFRIFLICQMLHANHDRKHSS